MRVSNWGNYPSIDARMACFGETRGLVHILEEFKDMISRGLGRSYGDSSLSERIISTLRFNRMLAFDKKEGIFTCESGTSLREILDVIVPAGWFLPVTPGTKHVTIGGAIASDVHGKNHHLEGSFSDHILSMEVMLSSGEIVTVTRENQGSLFRAICGGMGLIGVILRATLKLKKIETAYIRQTVIKARSLEEILELFECHGDAMYSVAWIDCLSQGENTGRSILMIGHHAPVDEIRGSGIDNEPFRLKGKRKIKVPFFLPGFVLNGLSAKIFNSFYYSRHQQKADTLLVDYDSFFYPLDTIECWNRVYGSRGFIQYQCVLPSDASRKGLIRMLHEIGRSGEGVFLAVLKLFGRGNDNFLSFPMEGYTLAMDFPVTSGLFALLDKLDEIVLEFGGKVYLAKDARMGERMFMNSYRSADEFMTVKEKFDPQGRFRSLQSNRIGIT